MKNNLWILHAGPPKTGSSSLQHWLHSHISELRDQGILYPYWGTRHVHHHELYLASKNTAPRFCYDALEFEPQKIDELVLKIMKSMEQSGCSAAILSSELLSTLSTKEFLGLVSKIKMNAENVIAVFTHREEKSFSYSVAEELVKNGDTRSYESLCDQGRELWKHCFQNLIPFLKKNSVNCQILDIHDAENVDLDQQFLRVIEVAFGKKIRLKKPFCKMNTSLTDSIVKKIAVFNIQNYNGLILGLDFMPKISNNPELIKNWCDFRKQRESIWVK